MRHCKKRHRLNRPQDQRKALLRSLATSLIQYDEIHTTEQKAKALKPYMEKLVDMAKIDTVHARRNVLRYIYNVSTGDAIEVNAKSIECTVLRKLFNELSPRYADRTGGYVRILKTEPRRGDNAPMAIIQFV